MFVMLLGIAIQKRNLAPIFSYVEQVCLDVLFRACRLENRFWLETKRTR